MLVAVTATVCSLSLSPGSVSVTLWSAATVPQEAAAPPSITQEYDLPTGEANLSVAVVLLVNAGGFWEKVGAPIWGRRGVGVETGPSLSNTLPVRRQVGVVAVHVPAFCHSTNFQPMAGVAVRSAAMNCVQVWMMMLHRPFWTRWPRSGFEHAVTVALD